MDEEEEDISQNTGETDEPTETEENAGEETEVQNIEDDKSEADKPDVVENEGDVDQIGDIEEFMEEQEFRRHDIENEEFLLLETCQITFEEEQKQRELMKEMEIAEKAEALGDEDEKREQDDEEQKSEASGEQMGDKESIFTKGRGSIFYEIGPRIRDLEDNQLFIGDFLLKEDNVPLKFYKLMDGKEEEECEEESKPEEEEITIDRVPYYEKHENIMAEITRERVKNNILQKKLAKFFKRRKMDHVLKETEQQFDTQEKYGKKLNAFGELSKLDYDQRTTITNELENLRTERENKFYELNKIFNDLQLQEKDTGYGLIHTKTGKPIPDKLIERLLNRQKHQMQTVGDMRLIYIQLKNMVAEKQNAISQIDKIGDNLYLMDFEQLKVENRSYMDKMEEKDEELSRLRNKCQKTIQILAHMREKSAALENDICDMTDDLQNLNQNSIAVGVPS